MVRFWGHPAGISSPRSLCPARPVGAQRTGTTARPATRCPRAHSAACRKRQVGRTVAVATAVLPPQGGGGEGTLAVAFLEKPICFFTPGRQAEGTKDKKEMGMWGPEREGKEASPRRSEQLCGRTSSPPCGEGTRHPQGHRIPGGQAPWPLTGGPQSSGGAAYRPQHDLFLPGRSTRTASSLPASFLTASSCSLRTLAEGKVSGQQGTAARPSGHRPSGHQEGTPASPAHQREHSQAPPGEHRRRTTPRSLLNAPSGRPPGSSGGVHAPESTPSLPL